MILFFNDEIRHEVCSLLPSICAAKLSVCAVSLKIPHNFPIQEIEFLCFGHNTVYRLYTRQAPKGGNLLKIAICDDEPYIRSYLASLVRKQDPEAAVREYASASDYLSDGTDPDLLFLDIELKEPDPNGGKRPPQASAPDTACQAAPPSDSQRMPPSDWTPCENGMELARRIRAAKEGPQPLIIFVTGHEAYVYDAFDVNAFQYLLKPIEEPRFAEIFRRAADQIRAKKELQRKKLVIQYAGTSKVIPLDSIYYMESRGHKIILHQKDAALEYYARLGDLEQTLQEQFCRIHKGFLINLAYVESYTKTEVTLTNGVKLNMSKYKYETFVKAHLHFMQYA